ncbi:MAG: response regulator [Polyangiaceae bacterium]|jgi:CheY-like chemotaxis protein|nr:response regulator [Polyangiaceae bacterium]
MRPRSFEGLERFMGLRGYIIIAEDNDDQRELLAMLLEREGFEVEQACDGQGLLDLVGRLRNQGDLSALTLIISDIMMPAVSGFDALEALRREHLNVPFVFLSALSDQQTLARAKEMGALGVLRKPFDLNAMHQVLNELTLAAVSAA